MPTQVTTGRGLSPAAAFTGLVDHGLFSEKLPPCFTSEGLSACLPPALLPVTNEVNPKKLRKLLGGKTHNYIRYSLLRDSNVPRQLGVPHPESYLAQCLGIQRFFPTIKRHCSKPHPPVSRIFVRRTAGKRVFQMNYQGQERFDNTELDLQHMTGAAYVAHTDISSCFPSIYTHSIPWALHGKATAKQDRSSFSAGNLLDRATQCTQDGQTNGLLVGPHSSNLLAEIILTSVDEKILKRGYSRVVRHIDDYRFYAKTHEEAERFLRELSLELRKFELVLNDRKTQILRMPRPLANEWVRQLNGSRLARSKGRVGIGPPRALLDLALKLAQENGTSAVLNYAIKMVPARLYPRARPLFVRQVVNLALQYPYLATLLDVHLFQKHRYDGIETIVREFSDELVVIGTRRLFSDAICQALYLALKYGFDIPSLDEQRAKQILDMSDCLSDVLLFSYSGRHGLGQTRRRLRQRVNQLLGRPPEQQDRFWLLLYEVSTPQSLRQADQEFLADLKDGGFRFLRFE